MAVLKNKTQGNYTLVSQNIMRDTNLSLTERGMLLTLLSLPDNWHLTLKGLSLILPDGRDKIAKTLNSLIDKGYLDPDCKLDPLLIDHIKELRDQFRKTDKPLYLSAAVT